MFNQFPGYTNSSQQSRSPSCYTCMTNATLITTPQPLAYGRFQRSLANGASVTSPRTCNSPTRASQRAALCDLGYPWQASGNNALWSGQTTASWGTGKRPTYANGYQLRNGSSPMQNYKLGTNIAIPLTCVPVNTHLTNPYSTGTNTPQVFGVRPNNLADGTYVAPISRIPPPDERYKRISPEFLRLLRQNNQNTAVSHSLIRPQTVALKRRIRAPRTKVNSQGTQTIEPSRPNPKAKPSQGLKTVPKTSQQFQSAKENRSHSQGKQLAASGPYRATLPGDHRPQGTEVSNRQHTSTQVIDMAPETSQDTHIEYPPRDPRPQGGGFLNKTHRQQPSSQSETSQDFQSAKEYRRSPSPDKQSTGSRPYREDLAGEPSPQGGEMSNKRQGQKPCTYNSCEYIVQPQGSQGDKKEDRTLRQNHHQNLDMRTSSTGSIKAHGYYRTQMYNDDDWFNEKPKESVSDRDYLTKKPAKKERKEMRNDSDISFIYVKAHGSDTMNGANTTHCRDNHRNTKHCSAQPKKTASDDTGTKPCSFDYSLKSHGYDKVQVLSSEDDCSCGTSKGGRKSKSKKVKEEKSTDKCNDQMSYNLKAHGYDKVQVLSSDDDCTCGTSKGGKKSKSKKLKEENSTDKCNDQCPISYNLKAHGYDKVQVLSSDDDCTCGTSKGGKKSKFKKLKDEKSTDKCNDLCSISYMKAHGFNKVHNYASDEDCKCKTSKGWKKWKSKKPKEEKSTDNCNDLCSISYMKAHGFNNVHNYESDEDCTCGKLRTKKSKGRFGFSRKKSVDKCDDTYSVTYLKAHGYDMMPIYESEDERYPLDKSKPNYKLKKDDKRCSHSLVSECHCSETSQTSYPPNNSKTNYNLKKEDKKRSNSLVNEYQCSEASQASYPDDKSKTNYNLKKDNKRRSHSPVSECHCPPASQTTVTTNNWHSYEQHNGYCQTDGSEYGGCSEGSLDTRPRIPDRESNTKDKRRGSSYRRRKTKDPCSKYSRISNVKAHGFDKFEVYVDEKKRKKRRHRSRNSLDSMSGVSLSEDATEGHRKSRSRRSKSKSIDPCSKYSSISYLKAHGYDKIIVEHKPKTKRRNSKNQQGPAVDHYTFDRPHCSTDNSIHMIKCSNTSKPPESYGYSAQPDPYAYDRNEAPSRSVARMGDHKKNPKDPKWEDCNSSFSKTSIKAHGYEQNPYYIDDGDDGNKRSQKKCKSMSQERYLFAPDNMSNCDCRVPQPVCCSEPTSPKKCNNKSRKSIFSWFGKKKEPQCGEQAKCQDLYTKPSSLRSDSKVANTKVSFCACEESSPDIKNSQRDSPVHGDPASCSTTNLPRSSSVLECCDLKPTKPLSSFGNQTTSCECSTTLDNSNPPNTSSTCDWQPNGANKQNQYYSSSPEDRNSYQATKAKGFNAEKDSHGCTRQVTSFLETSSKSECCERSAPQNNCQNTAKPLNHTEMLANNNNPHNNCCQESTKGSENMDKRSSSSYKVRSNENCSVLEKTDRPINSQLDNKDQDERCKCTNNFLSQQYNFYDVQITDRTGEEHYRISRTENCTKDSKILANKETEVTPQSTMKVLKTDNENIKPQGRALSSKRTSKAETKGRSSEKQSQTKNPKIKPQERRVSQASYRSNGQAALRKPATKTAPQGISKEPKHKTPNTKSQRSRASSPVQSRYNAIDKCEHHDTERHHTCLRDSQDWRGITDNYPTRYRDAARLAQKRDQIAKLHKFKTMKLLENVKRCSPDENKEAEFQTNPQCLENDSQKNRRKDAKAQQDHTTYPTTVSPENNLCKGCTKREPKYEHMDYKKRLDLRDDHRGRCHNSQKPRLAHRSRSTSQLDIPKYVPVNSRHTTSGDDNEYEYGSTSDVHSRRKQREPRKNPPKSHYRSPSKYETHTSSSTYLETTSNISATSSKSGSTICSSSPTTPSKKPKGKCVCGLYDTFQPEYVLGFKTQIHTARGCFTTHRN